MKTIVTIILLAFVGTGIIAFKELQGACDSFFGVNNYHWRLMGCGVSVAELTGVSSINCSAGKCTDQNGRELQTTKPSGEVYHATINGQEIDYQIATVTLSFPAPKE